MFYFYSKENTLAENDQNQEEPKNEANPSDEKSAEKASVSPEEEAARLKNEYLYLRAEFDNYKKNAIKERSDLIKYGSERLLVEVLGILDIFDRALETEVTAENLDSYVQGMSLTKQEFVNMLQKFGAKELECVGQAFDPLKHDALSSVETAEFEEGHVSQVVKKGYTLHNKVIRPAQVIVAKKPSEAQKEE